MDESIENGDNPKGARAKPIILLIIGLLLVAVVVLVFVLINHDSGPGASDPISLARKFIRAVEEEDIELCVDCYVPGAMVSGATPLHYIESALEDGENILEQHIQATFDEMEIKFEKEKVAIGFIKGDYAGVMVMGGLVSVSFPDGGYSRNLKQQPVWLHMQFKDGRWYMDDDVSTIWVIQLEEYAI